MAFNFKALFFAACASGFVAVLAVTKGLQDVRAHDIPLMIWTFLNCCGLGGWIGLSALIAHLAWHPKGLEFIPGTLMGMFITFMIGLIIAIICMLDSA